MRKTMNTNNDPAKVLLVWSAGGDPIECRAYDKPIKAWDAMERLWLDYVPSDTRDEVSDELDETGTRQYYGPGDKYVLEKDYAYVDADKLADYFSAQIICAGAQ